MGGWWGVEQEATDDSEEAPAVSKSLASLAAGIHATESIEKMDELGGQDLDFVTKIEFDTECRYFIAYGACSVFVLDLETAKGSIYSVDKR